MTRSSLAIALLVSVAATTGCYKPNLVDGGFRCADSGACPDGFQCKSDGLCHSGKDAAPDVPVPPMCKSVTPDAATCARDPAPGQDCNPACESGCKCGWCAASNGQVACVTGTPGTKKSGEVCNPSNSFDCAPGLYCVSECQTAHCHKYCDPSNGASDCAAVGGNCSKTVANGANPFSVCDFPKTACNPVTGTGCPSGYACYPFGTGVECDCAGTNTGTACNLVQECAPGYTCINAGGAQICRKTCLMNSDCGTGQCSTAAGVMYGYCTS